jgi:hypothetical protein
LRCNIGFVWVVEIWVFTIHSRMRFHSLTTISCPLFLPPPSSRHSLRLGDTIITHSSHDCRSLARSRPPPLSSTYIRTYINTYVKHVCTFIHMCMYKIPEIRTYAHVCVLSHVQGCTIHR